MWSTTLTFHKDSLLADEERVPDENDSETSARNGCLQLVQRMGFDHSLYSVQLA